jgi:hypothetical protein
MLAHTRGSNMKDFEDYLQTKHAEQYHGLDDDMPDDYNEWIENLDTDTWIKYGDDFGTRLALEHGKEIQNIYKK